MSLTNILKDIIETTLIHVNSYELLMIIETMMYYS